jgi:hypothetical protein
MRKRILISKTQIYLADLMLQLSVIHAHIL